MEKIEERSNYEVGFILSPLVPEEDLTSKIEEIFTAAIKNAGGELVNQYEAQLINLAYPIRVMGEGKYDVFKNGYFGAIKFLLDTGKIEDFQKALKLKKEVIRSLVMCDKIILNIEEPVVEGEGVSEKDEPASEATIDKEIDQLLAEAV